MRGQATPLTTTTLHSAPVSNVLVDAAEAAGAAPLDRSQRLYDHVDPDALEAVVRSGDTSLLVSFEAWELRFVLRGDGTLAVYDPDDWWDTV